MQRAKILPALSLLLFASTVGFGQTSSSPQQNGPDQRQVSTLLWNSGREVTTEWLRQNEAALNNGDACTLALWWRSEDDRKAPSGSVFNIVSFIADPKGKPLTRIFSESNSGLQPRVGVQYLRDDSRASRSYLQIALAFEGDADDVFDEITRSEAGTWRHRDWRSLRVAKDALVGRTRYTFALTCENGKTFLGFLRHPPKHDSRSSQ